MIIWLARKMRLKSKTIEMVTKSATKLRRVRATVSLVLTLSMTIRTIWFFDCFWKNFIKDSYQRQFVECEGVIQRKYLSIRIHL